MKEPAVFPRFHKNLGKVYKEKELEGFERYLYLQLLKPNQKGWGCLQQQAEIIP